MSGEPLPLRLCIPDNNCSIILSLSSVNTQSWSLDDHVLCCLHIFRRTGISKTTKPATSHKFQHLENRQFTLFFPPPFKVSPLIQRAGSRPGSGRLPALTTTCMQYWSLLARRGWHLPVRRRSRVDRSLSQDRQSALCWLFGGVQSSLKCTSNGSLILHPCDVTAHLTNTIRGPCSFSSSVFFFFFLQSWETSQKLSLTSPSFSLLVWIQVEKSVWCWAELIRKRWPFHLVSELKWIRGMS